MDNDTATKAPAGAPDAPATDPDELEGSPARRLALTVFLAATLIAILASVMPHGTLRDGVMTAARPYLLSTGLDQDWGVFAPNPQRYSTFVTARVDRGDGSVAEYGVPSSRGLGAYWDYRWRKYADQLSQRNETGRERAAFARWAVDQDRAAGGDPVRVTLVRHTARLLPPGPQPNQTPYGERAIYSIRVGER